MPTPILETKNQPPDHSVRNDRGALHIIAIILVLSTIYSTLILLGSAQRIQTLEEIVAGQQKRIADLEMRVKVLQLKSHDTP